MLTRKCLGYTSLVAMGLMVACSDDSSNSPKDEISEAIENQETTTNPCIYDGYSAMQGAGGETLCLDAEGTLTFWINADGTYGFPEATQGATEGSTTEPSTTTPGESATEPTPSDPATEPSVDNPTETPTPAETTPTACTTDKALYSINGISYYKDADGNLYYFDASCTKTLVTVATPASSSSVSTSEGTETAVSSAANPASSESNVALSSDSQPSNPEPNSSADVAPSSSVSIENPSSSATVVTPSNGSVPTITYAASGATVENNNNCVTVTGGEVVITCAGDYDFSGSYSGSDAQIRVYSPKSDSGVYLNLRGLSLTNTADAPI